MRNYNTEYQDNSRKYSYDFDSVIRAYLLKAVAGHLAPQGQTLELGCYQGDMTAQIVEQYPRLTVVEASSELCTRVRERFAERVEVVNATFEEVQLERRFQNIFLVHTLEHLDEPVAVLAKVKDWLLPGARLVLAVPNANALSRQIAVRMGLVNFNSDVTPAEREHGHRRTYSMDHFEHHIRTAGLQIVESGGLLVKTMANFQFDKALAAGIVDDAYLDGCYSLGKLYPDLCASLFAVCEVPAAGDAG